MSQYADIRAALMLALGAVPGIPAAPYRADENTDFTATPGKPWLRTRLQPGIERLLEKPGRGGTLQRSGLLRVFLNFPMLTGTIAADALAQAAVDTFAAGQTLDANGLDLFVDASRRWSGGTDLEEGYYTVPVDIAWHVFTPNPLT